MIHIHIVTFNSAEYIERCVHAVHDTAGIPEQDFVLTISDNASKDETVTLLKDRIERLPGVSCIYNTSNLGFCAGQNQGATLFLKSSADYFLALNPDVVLRPDTLSALIHALQGAPDFEAATPLLLQADESLQPLDPERIDAAGMIFTKSLRHFDRYSGELRSKMSMTHQRVFGGTGACLMLSRNFVEKVSFRTKNHDADMFEIYPQLKAEAEERIQLFDEAYFAYRDDADLALRAGRLGLQYLFVPEAVAYHKRLVVPEKRSELPAIINALGVRNRFLLQMTNLSPCAYRRALWSGFILRNLLVLFGVFLWEQSSIVALKEAFFLRRRSRERYDYIKAHAACSQAECAELME